MYQDFKPNSWTMKNIVSYKLIFDRRKQAHIKGYGVIELVVYFNNQQRVWINTKLKIRKEHWNDSKKMVNAKNEKYYSHNNFLNTFKNEIIEYEYDLLNKGSELTPKNLKNFLTKGNDPSFIDYCFDKLMILNIELSTMQSQKRSINILKEFDPDLTFNDLNPSFVDLFNDMLNKRNYSPGTKWKVNKDIIKFVNLAIRDKKINSNEHPFEYFKNIRPKPNHDYLTFKELEQIEMLESTGFERVDLIKDMFLFACYTGLRYSDLFGLNYSDFNKRDGGLVLLLERMKKVDKRVFLRLYELFDGKPERLILPYYKKHKKDKFIFGKKISNQEMNQGLKIIQSAIKTNKTITVHLARHTFGTLYSKTSGSIFDVMKAMGISKYETAKVYIDLSLEL
mgnify:CR=1 FL=1